MQGIDGFLRNLSPRSCQGGSERSHGRDETDFALKCAPQCRVHGKLRQGCGCLLFSGLQNVQAAICI